MTNAIRRVEAGDAAAIRDIYAPYVADKATSFEVTVPGVEEMQRRIQSYGDRYPWLVFERDGVVLGYAYASSHHERQAYQWSVNVSVYVHASAHRSGLGRALYTALFDLLRRQGFVNAYGGITLPNPASVGLHESMGFTPVGVYTGVGYKFGRWHDVTWLHLQLVPPPQNAADPITIGALWHDPAVQAMFAACAESVRLA
jgi:L-amino acid N-acyltransferase YncA